MPAASAGASFHVAIRMGKFHGMISPDHAQRFVEVVRDGVVVDLAERTLLGAQRSREVAEVVDGERDVGRQGLPYGLAVLQLSATASSSRWASIRSAILFSTDARSPADVAPQPGAAAWADVRARSTSSDVPRAISVNGRPLTGLGFSKYCPRAGGTCSPPIQWS